MNKFKKIGLTALAASLVSVSAHAGEMSVSGGASLTANGFSGEGNNEGTSFTMGNQLTFTGGGELDNGVNVSLSFVIDQGDDTADAAGTSPFDSHSITLSTDSMGSLKFAGEGGGSVTASHGTAAGGLWDAFDQEDFSTVTGAAVIGDLLSTHSGGDDSFFYTSPELMSGLIGVVSYNPKSTDKRESEKGWGVNYTGIDGLTLNYATQDVEGASNDASGDAEVYKAAYVYGSLTATVSYHETDLANTTNADTSAQSYALSYTVTDDLSITYGVEEHDQAANTAASHDDPSLDRISASYTAGGMTLTGKITNGDNLTRTSATNGDQQAWSLGASFAF
jgi:outer membrane protein OmpU